MISGTVQIESMIMLTPDVASSPDQAIPEAHHERVLRFLLNPESYPHHPKRVRLIQTHASSVFITPPWVYKVKKAVNFGFLDYSTLEKRRIACEREISLNRRLSPHVYVEVVPIRQNAGQLTLGKQGEIVDYAVKMRHLAERYFFDRRVENEKATHQDIQRIVDTLAPFYLKQKPTPEIESWGAIRKLKVSTSENFAQTRRFIGMTLSRPMFEALQSFTTLFYRQHRALFESRVRKHWIRDCHGDLHLDHIHLTPRTVHIYDCIEFNDRFRYVDVASDLAFLSMDLNFRGRPDLAQALVKKMSVALGDTQLSRLIPFYETYRAYVRGKVESLHSLSMETEPTEQPRIIQKAQKYFSLALHHAVSGDVPLVLAVMGRIGSGKSTLAKGLSEALGWELVSSDQVRKDQAGLPRFERSSAEKRSQLYTAARTRQTYRYLTQRAVESLKRGNPIILDATFARPEQRAALKRALRSKPQSCLFVEVTASDRETRKHLRDRENATHEASDARLEDFEPLSKLYHPPKELRTDELLKLRSSGDAMKVLTQALKALVSREACRTLGEPRMHAN